MKGKLKRTIVVKALKQIPAITMDHANFWHINTSGIDPGIMPSNHNISIIHA